MGPLYDQWFLIGAWLAPFVFLRASFGLTGAPLLAFFLYALVDKSHLLATVPLTLTDSVAMAQRGALYRAITFASLGLALLCAWQGGMVLTLWLSLFPPWALFHIVRQHYGFLRLYQARTGADARAAALEALCLYSGTAFPILLQFATWSGNDAFSARFLRPPVPAWLPWPVLAVFVGSALAVAASAMQRWHQGREVGGVRLVLIALAVSNFWVAGLGPGRSRFAVAAFFVATFHALQYHALLWHVLKQRFTRAEGATKNTLASLFHGARPWRYVAAAFASGFVMTLMHGLPMPQLEHAYPRIVDLLFSLSLAVGYAHYAIDAYAWRLGSDRRLRDELGLTAPARPMVQAG